MLSVWQHLDKKQQQEWQQQEETLVLGQLGAFAYNMLFFGVPFSRTREFLVKMCLSESLNENQIDDLMMNLETFKESIDEEVDSELPIEELRNVKLHDHTHYTNIDLAQEMLELNDDYLNVNDDLEGSSSTKNKNRIPELEKIVTEYIEKLFKNQVDLEQQQHFQGQIFKSPLGRRIYARQLAKFAGIGKELEAECFEKVRLELDTFIKKISENKDFITVKILMITAATVYKVVEGRNEILQAYLKSHEIWKQEEFWNFWFFDLLVTERRKIFQDCWENWLYKWKSLRKEKQQELASLETGLIFAALCSGAYNMKQWGCPLSTMRHFLTHMSEVNTLSREYTNLLMELLESFSDTSTGHSTGLHKTNLQRKYSKLFKQHKVCQIQ